MYFSHCILPAGKIEGHDIVPRRPRFFEKGAAMTDPSRSTEVRAPLRVDGAELRLVRLPLVTPFTISTGTMHEKLFPLRTLRAGGIEGCVEGVMGPLPDYLEETVAGAVDLLCNGLLPQVL